MLLDSGWTIQVRPAAVRWYGQSGGSDFTGQRRRTRAWINNASKEQPDRNNKSAQRHMQPSRSSCNAVYRHRIGCDTPRNSNHWRPVNACCRQTKHTVCSRKAPVGAFCLSLATLMKRDNKPGRITLQSGRWDISLAAKADRRITQ